ncbi:MAG: hypothetical protein COA68_12310 [Oceanobacter sp.]|nr:MAG: hypothetical protein COA68_12310 [Oceanobacter sp.]
MANLHAIDRLTLVHEECKEFFRQSQEYLGAEMFVDMETSRTIKKSRMSSEDLALCTKHGKFKRIEDLPEPLPPGFHGVNVWTLKETKHRRRKITEPLLNVAVRKDSMPRTRYPSRLERRQGLKACRYMLQLDMDAYYDSIPIQKPARRLYVFKGMDGWYELLTLPTGARWSVCVGQGITWVVVDFDHQITIWTMIDNILLGAEEGQESEFVDAVRRLCRRLQRANLQTSPPAGTILRMSDDEILELARQEQTFLGEHYAWDDETKTRLVSNSTKTIAKLIVATRAEKFTFRSFMGLLGLILYAMHTVSINAARFFGLFKAYRGIAQSLAKDNHDWDDEIPFVATAAREEIAKVTDILVANQPVVIPERRLFTYDDGAFDDIIFIDASVTGWGAIHRHGKVDAQAFIYQRKWQQQLSNIALKPGDVGRHFYAKFSAHAEPTGVRELVEHLERKGRLGRRVAVVTDHFAIVQAQARENGYGGVGKGYALNSLFRATNEHDILFFYIAGHKNPSDYISRNFTFEGGEIVETRADVALPRLIETYCPIIELARERPSWMR